VLFHEDSGNHIIIIVIKLNNNNKHRHSKNKNLLYENNEIKHNIE